jgi:hypothetical protein
MPAPSGLDARKIEQRVDQPEQADGVPVHERQLVVCKRAVRCGERVLDRSEQQRQRRAELVADVAEKAVLARSSSASASARALASSSARALAIAVPICAATSERKLRYSPGQRRRCSPERATSRSRPP